LQIGSGQEAHSPGIASPWQIAWSEGWASLRLSFLTLLLTGFENVKNIFLESELFTVQNDLLVRILMSRCVSLKSRRQRSRLNVSKSRKSIRGKLSKCIPILATLLNRQMYSEWLATATLPINLIGWILFSNQVYCSSSLA
jgi:hypothetical protein